MKVDFNHLLTYCPSLFLRNPITFDACVNTNHVCPYAYFAF